MNNKKGFTLIELLAVIVILAVIALIVTPIVTGIIDSAKESANARSVEGHIKDVEYAILSLTMDTGNTSQFDTTEASHALAADVTTKLGTQNPSDKVTCSSYTIKNGTVSEASGCKDSSWTSTYSIKSGENAKKSA